MFKGKKVMLYCVWAMIICFPLVAYAAEPLPRVKILGTGGTIAAVYDKKIGAFRVELTADAIVAAVPKLKEIARIEVESVYKIGSTSMTPTHWWTLSKRVNEVLADPGVVGVVITHGTDTLEETAYFLDLTVASKKPVIVVGSQRAATVPDSDGPRNLLNAVRVAVSPEAVGKGTMVVLNGQINAARDVTKTSTSLPETFKCLEFGQLGVVDMDGAVRFYRAPLRRQYIRLPADPNLLPRVEIILFYAGADGRKVRGLLSQGPLDGLVIAGTGCGHVGPLENIIKEVVGKGIPVVISTRVYTGRIMDLYGSDKRLVKMGCLRSDNLSPLKSRILLMTALTQTKDLVELQKIFKF